MLPESRQLKCVKLQVFIKPLHELTHLLEPLLAGILLHPARSPGAVCFGAVVDAL